MPNHNFITDRIATGGDLPSHAGTDAWVDELDAWLNGGITHVVDNRVEWSDEDVVTELTDLRYLHNGVDDAGGRQPDVWFDQGVAWVLEALEDPQAKVLIHCHMGINRGPSLAYAVLLHLGWDPVEAIEAIRTVRPIAAVGYAEDALDWHHRRSGASASEQLADRRRLAAWHAEHPIDVVRIIRRIRHAEDEGRVA